MNSSPMLKTCPICREKVEPFGSHSGYTLVRCLSDQCRHVCMADIPSEEELKEFYNTSSSELWNSDAFNLLSSYRRNSDFFRRYFFRERTRFLYRFFPEKMADASTRILDVGCSSGVYLATLRERGFKVCGQDIASQAVQEGKRLLDIDLADRPLDQCGFEGQFDLVTCYDVIEHWPDPRQLLRGIRKQAGPGAGIVLRTPNHSSWLRCITGKNWLWYIPPAHIHYFTPQSLSLLMAQEGFEVVSTRTGSNTYLFFLAYYLLPAMRQAGGERARADMGLVKEMLVFGLDNMLRMLLYPLILPIQLSKADTLLEVYARPVTA